MNHRKLVQRVSILGASILGLVLVALGGCGDRAEPLRIDPLGEPLWTVRHGEATFSSPQTADLNGDGVLDIVQGFGQDTLGVRQSSVIAIDGASGDQLWSSTGHEDLIGSAQFAALGGDLTPDVIIGGRRGALLAIDGATGELLWNFDDQDRWFNFYTPQLIEDRDGDGVLDIVAANGGLVFREPSEDIGLAQPETRNLGTTFVVSGATGDVIGTSPVPDRGEAYMSPLLVEQGTEVLIGTGGETLHGSLWRVPLDSLADGTTDGAVEVLDGGAKGIIAVPSLGHLTGDDVLDVVVPSFDGTISAVDGATDELLWQVPNAGFETYSSPTLGYFVGDDDVPDVFASIALGTWPIYESSDYLLINGATGVVTWRQTLGTFAPSGFVAVDLNGDGRDEPIFGVNSLDANTQEILVLDTDSLKTYPLVTVPQTTFAAPWVGDLDGDGVLDLIVTESAYQSAGSAPESAAVVRRYTLPSATAAQPSWGSYLGTDSTGRLSSGW